MRTKMKYKFANEHIRIKVNRLAILGVIAGCVMIFSGLIKEDQPMVSQVIFLISLSVAIISIVTIFKTLKWL